MKKHFLNMFAGKTKSQELGLLQALANLIASWLNVRNYFFLATSWLSPKKTTTSYLTSKQQVVDAKARFFKSGPSTSRTSQRNSEPTLPPTLDYIMISITKLAKRHLVNLNHQSFQCLRTLRCASYFTSQHRWWRWRCFLFQNELLIISNKQCFLINE